MDRLGNHTRQEMKQEGNVRQKVKDAIKQETQVREWEKQNTTLGGRMALDTSSKSHVRN